MPGWKEPPLAAGPVAGGRAAGEWVLLWKGPLAAAWSAHTGWVELPRAPAEIRRATPVRDGLAVVAGPHLGLWAPGSRDWGWWQAPPEEVEG